MNSDYAAVVGAWIAKAHSDLATAKILIGGDERHLDTGTYHCQQAAEKALKGWLTSRQREFRKTHDLLELLHQCTEISPSFASLLEATQFLVPLASHFRYPGETFEPTPSDSNEALNHAQSVVQFVIAQLKTTFPDSFPHL